MFMDGQIAFVEFPARDLAQMRRFYGAAFGWGFAWAMEERGSNYVAFRGFGAEGGFSTHPTQGPVEPLVVLYMRDLEAARAHVCAAGGEITREIFASRGGRRFHFRDPGENEVAVWSDTVPPPPVPVSARKPQWKHVFAFWRNWGACTRPTPRSAPSPAPPPAPRPMPEAIRLTDCGGGDRTKHEHTGEPPCARTARSTM